MTIEKAHLPCEAPGKIAVIGVTAHHELALHRGETGVERRRNTPLWPGNKPCPGVAEAFHHACGAIGAAVIDHDDFERRTDLTQNRAERLCHETRGIAHRHEYTDPGLNHLSPRELRAKNEKKPLWPLLRQPASAGQDVAARCQRVALLPQVPGRTARN